MLVMIQIGLHEVMLVNIWVLVGIRVFMEIRSGINFSKLFVNTNLVFTDSLSIAASGEYRSRNDECDMVP